MDGGRDASLIGKDQCALAVNATFRGGFPRTRPYFVARPLTFTSDEERSWFETELYQGCYFYSLIAAPNAAVSLSNQGFFIYMVGGRLWSINPTTYRATEITPKGSRNSRLRNLSYFVQAEQWLVVQDGQSAAILWDGSNARRAGLNEVPVGTEMAYGQGRTWVIVGNQVFAGDIVGGPGGPNAVINFTERKILQQSGDLSPSFVIGNPKFLEFIPQQDTATGVGTLLVGGETGVTSIFAEKPRTSWADGITRVVLFNVGATGHRSPVQINGDIWWRSTNGMRSYRQARGQVAKLAQIPLSTELDPFFNQDTPAFLPWVSSTYFDNRLLCTLSPRCLNGRIYFQGLGIADYNILSSFGETITKPAWDGVWTGVNIYEIRTGGGRCFAPSIDPLGRNCLYEVTLDNQRLVADREIDGKLRPVECQLVSGAYVGNRAQGSSITTVQTGMSQVPKRLHGGMFSVRNVRERVDVHVDYRKDGEQCFQPWDSFSFCANNTLCSVAPDLAKTPCPQLVANPQYRIPVLLKQPDAQHQVTDDPPIGAGSMGSGMTYGFEFQSRFRWTGNLQLRAFTMDFISGFERLTSGCFPTEDCSTSMVCCEDLFEFTPKLPVYLIPINPVDPTANVLEAEQLLINYLGNGLLHPIDQTIASIPLPPNDVQQALVNLINNGTVSQPSGGGGAPFVRLGPIREL